MIPLILMSGPISSAIGLAAIYFLSSSTGLPLSTPAFQIWSFGAVLAFVGVPAILLLTLEAILKADGSWDLAVAPTEAGQS